MLRRGRFELGVTKAPLQEKIDRFAHTIGVIVLQISNLSWFMSGLNRRPTLIIIFPSKIGDGEDGTCP